MFPPRVFLLGLVGLTTFASPTRAEPLPVDVQVEGVAGPLRDNVLRNLSIYLAASGGPLQEDEVRRLHGRARGDIELALEAFGHYRPEIRSALAREKGRWGAAYTIIPGPPLVLVAVDVRASGPGAESASTRRAVEAFPLRKGDPLRHDLYVSGKRELLGAATATGYLDAAYERSEIRIDLEAYEVRIALHLVTGPAYVFGPVRFEQDVLYPEYVRGYAEFQPGDPFSFDKLLTLQKKLSEQPYFGSVEVKPRRDLSEEGAVPIDVVLTPAKPQRYLFGMGYGTDTGAHGRVGLELRRINRRAHRGRAELQGSAIEQRAVAEYFIPWPYPRSELLAISGGFQNLDPATSRSETVRIGVGLSRARGSWRESVSLSFVREQFIVGLDEGTAFLVLPELGWSRVEADDRIAPRRGYRALIDFRASSEQVGSNVGFLQVVGGAKTVQTAASWLRALARVEGGYTRTDAFRSLPPSMRFFAGGAQSVRGYAYRGIGPVDGAGNVIGGESLVEASLELEWRVLKSWGLAAFYDLGNALRSLDDPLFSGAGLGLRWISPVGPVRLDWAWALSVDGAPHRVHLALGPDL